MTLLDVMSLTAGIAGLCGAIRAARGAGPAALAIGIGVGLLIGTGAAWIPHRAGSRLMQRYALHEATSGWKLAASWLLAALLIAWVILSISFADYTTTVLLRSR